MLLALCMILSLLPGTAYAAVADLLENTAQQNQSLLEQLESFTGESYEEAYALLDSMGLLDENGNLITDQSIVLNGAEYTLDQVEAMLADPSVDLTQVAVVDGVPIALKDLATIIAIERQLQYLQETYFTGRTFEGEALENVNSLLAQLQSEGMTLAANSAGNEVVFNQEGSDGSIDGYSTGGYICASNVHLREGDTYQVKFKLAVPEAIRVLGEDVTIKVCFDTQQYSQGSLAALEIPVREAVADPDKEYTLSYTVTAEDISRIGNFAPKFYLHAVYKHAILGSNITPDDLWRYYPNRSFGTFWGGVSFYEPEGFVFGDSSGNKKDTWNCLFDFQHTMPQLVGSWTQSAGEREYANTSNEMGAIHIYIGDSGQVYSDLDDTLTYLQMCKADQGVDNWQRFHIAATIRQTNPNKHTLMTSLGLLQSANYNFDTPNSISDRFVIDVNSANGFPIILPSGSDTTTISFDAYLDRIRTDSALQSLPAYFTVPYGIDTTVTEPGNPLENINTDTNGAAGYVSNASVTLVNDGNGPLLTVTAPAGTYQSGDLIPINIYADEYIQTNNARITINGTEYNLSDLHASSSGKFISLLYEVKEFDSAGLTVSITSQSGITDFFGNQADENMDVTGLSGVSITSPLLKNGVTGLTASYNADTQKLTFGIAVNQDSRYQNLYTLYNDTAMQLLVSVDGAAAVTHPVTMGGSGNTITFTAADYEVPQTSADQAVTVQLQVTNGSGGWTTLGRLTTSVTVPRLVKVTDVTIDVVDKPEDYNYTIALSDEDIPQLEASVTPSDATYKTGTWSSNNPDVAGIEDDGQIVLNGVTGTVSFTYTADNGTPDDPDDDVTSDPLKFTITAGDKLDMVIPKYAQESLIQAGSNAAVTWNTNVFEFYPDATATFTIALYNGTDTAGTPIKTYDDVTATSENRVTSYTILAEDLPVTYPQSQYTVKVTMTVATQTISREASITVLSPPTEMRITANKTAITDSEQLALNCSISNGSATGTLSVKRVADGAANAEDVTGSCLFDTSVVSNGGGTITFKPLSVTSGLYDTYTITFTENTVSGSQNFAPSSDSIVITVYRSGALDILVDGESKSSFELSNQSAVSSLPTDSQGIMALRQQLGLIEYVSINADAYNWGSVSDGIEWVSDHPEAVGVYYRQGGLWDNIEDLPYETYVPQSQMAVSATDDLKNVTITAIHAATNMSDSVTVSVETLRDKLYLFQVSPAAETTLTYTNGNNQKQTATTNSDGVLALYEPSGIKGNVYFHSGDDENPNLATISSSALSSGERDAAKLQLYPLNTITLRPAAEAELYLVKPDGTPYVGSVTLRGGVYLAGHYCEGVHLGSTPGSLIPGDTDGTYPTDPDGKITVYMDATQFKAEGYDGPLTNAELDYWFELSDLDGDSYYPTLVNIQGSMSADYTLRTGSAVVTLREVSGQAKEPFLIAQTLSYGKDSGDDLQVRNVMGSTGKVGPNSTYKYTELTTRIMLWGVEADSGAATVTMTGSNGFAPKAQTVDDNSFPFASIPIVTNTLVLTKETMTESGWLEAETAENLKASVYQNDTLVKTVSMPFQVIDLTDVQLVDKDAEALVVDMKASLVNGFGTTNGNFSFGNNKVGNAFGGKITSMLNSVQENVSPLFRVLITPTEDNSVFNVLVWGGYDSLDIDEFDYSQTGFAMDSNLMEAELDVGVPPLNDLSDMAKGTYDAVGTINETKYNRTNSGLDIGAQLTGYYEGQFYYDTDLHKWAFRTLGGGMSAGASLSFQANINAWVGPVPITATFAAGIALQLEFKAATVYADQGANTSGWTTEALKSDSVNDYLTTLRIQGYIDAFGGLGFDYSIIALKIGLFGRLTADSTNTFLSRTYLQKDQQLNGQALGISGEVGIKFFAKFLFVSYEAVIGSGKITSSNTFNDYTYIDNYWNGSSASGASLMSMGAPTLLSRAYLEAYANGIRTWASPTFSGIAAVVQDDANPGSEPKVNDDGTLSVYISDRNSTDYFASRIMAGGVGAEGTVINEGGFGDMSPSLSGTSSFSVAAWVRLQENLQKAAGEAISPAEEKQLLNSTEIMVATTSDGSSWTTTQLTNNASPDLAPVTAANGSSAAVFWRGVYTTSSDLFTDQAVKPSFDTQDVIYVSQYTGSGWSSQPTMVYNGSLGSVVGIQAAMLPNGTAIVVFAVDRTGSNDASGYEIAYRTVAFDGTLGDLVVLTSDSEIDTNPQVMAVTNGGTDLFLLGWYSSQDGGDIRLQAVGQSGQLYSGSSANAVPASVKAITGEDDLGISADFQFAKSAGQALDGLALVWAETANASGVADHSVLYGTRLCHIDGKLYLSTPQALITLPNRTLANSFSAWQSGSQVNAYIFGTWYSPTETEYVPGYSTPVAKDTDQLLTGGGTFAADALSVDTIAVDYADLRADSWTPVTFTLRNTGTTKLSDVVVSVEGGYISNAVALLPGESADAVVMYRTGDPITNPAYSIGTLDSGILHLDYNDVGISSMQVVREGNGQRTVQVTLYNDAAAKLKGSGRTVELSFYTDSEYTKPAAVTVGGQTGSTVTLSGDDLGRIDQGSMTVQATYDLAAYVTGTLKQSEVPASGVYLYAKATVKDSSGKAMAEYATGNNGDAVLLTGAYARTGEATTLDVSLTNTDVTTATVSLKNNCLQAQPDQGILLAVLLDKDGKELETQVVTPGTALACEETQNVEITFTKRGADVVLLYSSAATATGLQKLHFSGLYVELSDFVLVDDEDDPNYGAYVYTLPDEAPSATVVSFISGDKVTVNGTEYDKAGSAAVSIPGGTSTITVSSGGSTYILTLNRSSSGGVVVGPTSYPIIVEPSENGKVTANRSSASAGVTVTLTVVPDDGYRLADLTVTDRSGKAIALTALGEGRYSFAMPSSAATVKAAFAAAAPGDLPFIDVPTGAWYEEGVRYVYENGLMTGTSDTIFAPNVTTSRAMIATILWRMAGSPVVNYAMDFSDVAQGQWYSEAIRWAASEGIVTGYGNGTFGPNDPITREQMATMLYRYAQHQEYDVSVGEDTNLLSYTDFDQLGEWAISAMQWACGAGIINGTSATALSPQGSATRAQAAVMLKRFCEIYVTR